jgi:hypothetical protein
MYSELKPSTPELQELARQKILKAVKDYPNLSVQARWNKVRQENPKLFGELQARDWEEDDKAEAKERQENEPQPKRFSGYHGDMQPQTTRVQTAMCTARENPDGSLIIQGAFFNPLL